MSIEINPLSSVFGRFDMDANEVEKKYKDNPKGEIVFYGASNFTFWYTLDEDLLPYRVQNHGIGGSIDNDLMYYADRLLYSYEPSIVFIQTGSNDMALGMSLEQVNANKDKMYSMFRKNLPDATFVVMSALPVPLRWEMWPDFIKTNEYLTEYCATHSNMVFIDATDIMLTSNGDPRLELFEGDKLHLNDQGKKVWGNLIKERLAQIEKSKTNI